MTIPRWVSALAFATAVAAGAGWTRASAQGITTGAVSGIVTDSMGNPLSSVQIRIVNRATGYSNGGLTNEAGRYFVQGLEVGGPYSITARRIGFAPDTRDDQMIALAQVLRVDFRLAQQAAQLTGVQIVGTTAEMFAPNNMGTKATISDTALQRVPTLTRNLTDFIKIAPQVSSSGPGYSAGGMSNRMNNVQIDGATERDVFGLGSTGQPGAEVSSKSVSIDAVKEFQVILAPFDVRQGNFGGLLVNAVTKGGTNTLAGSLYYFYRNEKFGADTPVIRATPFERASYGFTLGGPIIRDKLHFFIAPELQTEDQPVGGPYLGQPASQIPAFPISEATSTRITNALRALGDPAPGSPGYVNDANPLRNFFGRLDYRLNDAHRLVFRYNYAYGNRDSRQQNTRSANSVVFSSNFHDFTNTKHSPVVQLFSNFGNGSFNELFLSYVKTQNRRLPLTRFPQVTVTAPRATSGTVNVIAGSDQFSQGNELDTETFELTNNFTFPVRNHTFTIGTRNEYVTLRNQFTQSSFGVWTFASIDSLEARNPRSFRRAIILRDDGNVYFDALQSAWYAQDQWQVTPGFAVNIGARMDISRFLEDVPYSAPIDSAYGRRTDDIPKSSFQFSPRIGFNWDITSDQSNQLRGGVGLFVGTPPYVWLENAYVNSGTSITFLNCNTGGSADPAPPFSLDISGPAYQVCRNGRGARPIGAVNFLDSDLKFPQPLRATLAYDRRLPWNLVGTVEGLFSRTLNQFFFINRNLAGVRGTDRFGRVLYGDTILANNGNSRPVLPSRVVAAGGGSRFSEALDIMNQSKDYAWNVTAQLRRRYANNWEGLVAYTHSRARDVQSFTSSTHISNWRFGRTVGTTPQDRIETTRSLFDQPHRIVASGSYTLNWLRRFATDFSVFYQGVSGAPHDYVYNSTAGSGDNNADGGTLNDLIYVPNDATNTNEIQFRASGTVTAAQQAQAFERFIEGSECLRKFRGRIMERNACRLPFFNNVDVAIRQNINIFGAQRLAVQFDVFNFGNLLNKDWGKQEVSPLTSNSNVPLITHVGQTTADARTAIPIVTFDTTLQEYIKGNFAANFWRTQLSVRYSF